MLAMTTTKNMATERVGFNMGTMLTRQVVLSNKCQCRKCGDIIESIHRHDFVRCGCGSIFTDGGRDYIRRGAQDLNDIIDLSETYEEQYEAQF